MIGQHEHPVSEVGKASKSVVSLFVNQVAYCSYTSRLHVAETAHGHSIRFSEIVGARIGTLYYGLGKVIAGLAGIRSPHSVLTSVQETPKTSLRQYRCHDRMDGFAFFSHADHCPPLFVVALLAA